MKTYLHTASNLKSSITFLALVSQRKSISGAREKPSFLAIDRRCGSTPPVGLARAVPPTNINFWLTFLLTPLQAALYEDLPV